MFVWQLRATLQGSRCIRSFELTRGSYTVRRFDKRAASANRLRNARMITRLRNRYGCVRTSLVKPPGPILLVSRIFNGPGALTPLRCGDAAGRTSGPPKGNDDADIFYNRVQLRGNAGSGINLAPIQPPGSKRKCRVWQGEPERSALSVGGDSRRYGRGQYG